MAKQRVNALQSFIFGRQDDTTNTALTKPLVQSGIGRVVSGAGATYQQEFVTFPTAFKTGTVPVVVTSSIGYRAAGSPYDPSAISDLTWSRFSASAVKPQATGFNAWLARFDGAGMSDDYYYSWIAVGEAP